MFETTRAFEVVKSFAWLESVEDRYGFGKSWRNDYLGSLEMASRILGKTWQRPVGVLAALDGPKVGASIGWLGSKGMFAAALVSLDETSEAVQEWTADDVDFGSPVPFRVEAELKCAFCGEPLIAIGREMQWLGPRDGLLLRLDIVPACVECRGREQEDPEYFLTAMMKLGRRPRLRVVDGDGEGDGQPIGRLRLVESDDEPEG